MLRPARFTSICHNRWIHFDGTNITNATALIKGYDSSRMCKFIRIKNCEIKNNPLFNGSGLVASYYTSDLEIINCISHDNGGDPHRSNGFYIGSWNTLIENCTAYNNASRGISINDNNRGTAANIIIRNTKAYNNNYGITVASGEGHKIYNNISWGNTGEGIDV